MPTVCGLVAFSLAFLPGLLGPYGTFIDEWYYAACARHLAWGYVDHPPLAPFVLRIAMAIAGEHLVVLRLISSALAALTVAGTGLLAWRLGAAGSDKASRRQRCCSRRSRKWCSASTR